MDDSPGDLLGQFYTAFDDSRLEDAVATFAQDVELIDPGLGVVHGRQHFQAYLESFKRAMPDAKAVVERLCVAGDTVLVEGRFVGTHTGPLASEDGDLPPSGARVDLRFADVSRVVDGQVVSYHTYYDQFALFTQLGLLDDAS